MNNKTQLHIAIDGREANVKNRVGSNVYAFEIIAGIHEILQKHHDDIKVTVLLASEKIPELPEASANWNYAVFGPTTFWTQWALPIHIFQHKNKYDILFTPGHYAPRICAIPYISSVMDTAYLEYPDQFKRSDTLKLTKWTKYSVENAKKVIAISKFTKNQVAKHYGKHPHDIVVAYPDAPLTKESATASEKKSFFKKHGIKEPYFLFVGTLQPRKNITTLIEAFEIFNRMQAGRSLKKKYTKSQKRKLKKTQLVLAGKVGWLADPIIEKIKSSKLRNRIITTGFISDTEKKVLYQNATASCLVGLYEGFGIPPLESLHYKTIPVVSNTTSLPEVVGEAGLLADPTDSQAIAEQLWQASTMTTKEKRAFKKAAGNQIKQFNWNKSAKTILDTIIETAAEHQDLDDAEY